jgi:hypothetical protein
MADLVPVGELVAQWTDDMGMVSVDDARIAEVLGAMGLHARSDAKRIEGILRQVLSDLSDEPLSLRIGNWRVDMSATVFRSGVTAALLVGAIEAAGINSTAVVVLAAVVPFLVDVDHVAVNPSDRMVLAALKTKLATPQERSALWDSLPIDLQHEITFLEFVDLLDRLERAGVIRAVDDEHYGLPPKHGIFRGRIGW